MEETFGDNFIRSGSTLTNASDSKLKSFCPDEMDHLLEMASAVGMLNTIVIISGFGYVTSVV